MAGATRIADLRPKPTEGMFHQGGGVLAGGGGSGGLGIIGGQELHQGRSELFGGPTGALAFQPMPLPVVDREAAL